MSYHPAMPPPGRLTAKPLADLLGKTFGDIFAKQGFASRELVMRWSEIVGAEVAAHAEPIKIQWQRPMEGQPEEPATLVLRVEGPVALEIQHAAGPIIERVNRFLGWNAIGRLSLRQAPLTRPKSWPQAESAGSGRGGKGRRSARRRRGRQAARGSGKACGQPQANVRRSGNAIMLR